MAELAVWPLVWCSVFVGVVSAGGGGGNVLSEAVKAQLELESGPEVSFAQSLTRDFLFFLTFVGQVVLFLIFFWEKPTTTKRWNVGEEAASKEDESVVLENEGQRASSSAPEGDSEVLERGGVSALIAPPEGSRATQEEERATTQMDEDFAPLETTIRDLQHRITGLERTLHRRKGHYPTESLKSRLRECISTITGTLSSLEAQTEADPNSPSELDRSVSPNRIDITRWPLESIQSSKRLLESQLEQLEASHSEKTQDSLVAPVLDSSSPSKSLLPSDATQPTLSTSFDPSKPSEHSAQDSHDSSDSQISKEPILANDLGLDEQDLEILAQQLIGPKKGRKAAKGGKVKISAKDVSALNFFGGASPDDTLPALSLESHLISSPSIDDSSVTSQPIDRSPSPTDHFSDSGSLSPSHSPRPNTKDSPSTTEDSLQTPSSEIPVKEIEKSEDDELADLARLMASAPGKKGKNARKDKNPTKPAVVAPAAPANIFNMFNPLPSLPDTSSQTVASPSDSPRSEKSTSSGEVSPRDEATEELLASLGASDLPSLDGLSLPNDFSLPSDDVDVAMDASTDDLLAALNAVSEAQKKSKIAQDDDEATSDEESGDGTSDDEAPEASETTTDEEDEELDEIALERPAVSGFAASEALNKSGLARAKKSVPLNKGGKKGSYQMEDYHFCEFPWVKESWGLFCVFDGHSGKDCAETAARILPGKLQARLEKLDLSVVPPGGLDLSDVLKETFLETDKELLEFEYEGCTCTVVFIYKTQNGHRYMQAANVGDSSACLVRKEKAIELTEDHHPNYPKEYERIKAMGVDINPGTTRLNGLAVSRALGDQFPKSTDCGIIASPSVSPVYELKDRDSHIILASDGLWDVINFQTAYNIIKSLDSPSDMSDALLKTATRSSKCTDNVTTVVVQL